MTSPTDQQAQDQHYMNIALRLAARGLGRVAPNPAVGCVIVADGMIVGRGWTQPGGRPHAETVALEMAGELARNATAYVTLEPCSHHGKTPPCSDALIKAGISRVVVALQDPDDRVNGQGLNKLKAAGISITEHICEKEALEQNLGFILSKTINRPLVTLKCASTVDSKVATHSGQSKWITGSEARRYGHKLRAEHDAIMVGVGTALLDDPKLDCRIPGLQDRSPVRIVADSRLRLPLTSSLVRSAGEQPLWIVTAKGNPQERVEAFENLGIKVFQVGTDDSGYPDMKSAFELLVAEGMTRILVEGGSHLQASLIKEGLVDQIYWFRAAKLIGGDGIPSLQSLGLQELVKAPLLSLKDHKMVGNDLLEIYTIRNE